MNHGPWNFTFKTGTAGEASILMSDLLGTPLQRSADVEVPGYVAFSEVIMKQSVQAIVNEWVRGGGGVILLRGYQLRKSSLPFFRKRISMYTWCSTRMTVMVAEQCVAWTQVSARVFFVETSFS